MISNDFPVLKSYEKVSSGKHGMWLIHVFTLWISLIAWHSHCFSLPLFSAFNNILSNLGHVILGFLFLLIVLCRDILHRRALEAKDIFAMVRRGRVNQKWELGRVMIPNRICKGKGHLAWWCVDGLWYLRPEAWVSRSCGYVTHACLSIEHAFYFFQEYGIPKHFGLFYAMGIALMMEGVLSACYHVCPNYSNFQFGN